MLKGSCLCGGIRFEITGNHSKIGACHCSLCRKSSGVGSTAVITISFEQLPWVSGKDLVMTFERPSGYGSAFCRVCGSAAPDTDREQTMYAVPVGLLKGVRDAVALRRGLGSFQRRITQRLDSDPVLDGVLGQVGQDAAQGHCTDADDPDPKRVTRPIDQYSTTRRMIGDRAKRSFEEQGFVVARGLFGADETAFWRDHFMRLRESGAYPGDVVGVEPSSTIH